MLYYLPVSESEVENERSTKLMNCKSLHNATNT